MQSKPGVSGHLFRSLGKNGINVKAIAQGWSELNISVVVPAKDETKALGVLHDAFFLAEQKTVHLFLVGAGRVGKTLLQQLQEHQATLLQEQNLEVKLCGLANSRKAHFNETGVELNNWQELLESSERANVAQVVSKIQELNLPNSIFVDCTAADDIAKQYKDILNSSVSIVTPNKKANAGKYEDYLRLARAAEDSNVKFFYETTVGAGLPVINTLRDLLASGDEIIRIEAVLSGTLSYIFNSLKPGIKYSEVVRNAHEQGYTEPDPRDDLSGMDVARKLLILGREIGLPLEEADIKIQSLLSEDCLAATSVEEFFERLSAEDESFDTRIQECAREERVLRYIGIISDGKAQVGVEPVDRSHPFYGLNGSDNIISFTTARYSSTPLVVKGPGAGTHVTAAGVLADIIRVASYLI